MNEVKSGERISRKEFLAMVAKDNGMKVDTVTRVYDAMIDGIKTVTINGKTLCLTGFGNFYLQNHKGHPVQFDKDASIEDYVVFKFSASDVWNRKIRNEINGVEEA